MMDDLRTSELATILRALDREKAAALDKRRNLRPSVRAIMLAETQQLREKVAAELARRTEA